ncbi:MAG: hypothetical protein KKA79_10355 [Nanoarchaeota archaeon]|nr:hypothetical protein [Nanoarchaeota archaeon]MCG2718933.1 hypothetical protein [Nanoarchaeota archaeon]
MRNKKGAGTIIAWVLLLGFSIGLAITVFMWTTQQTEEMGKTSVRFVEGGMMCDNVMINVAVDNPTTCSITISNTRYLNISQISIRQLEGTPTSTNEPVNLAPRSKDIPESQSKYSKVTGYCGDIEVMPIITINEELVGCKNKAITIECDDC